VQAYLATKPEELWLKLQMDGASDDVSLNPLYKSLLIVAVSVCGPPPVQKDDSTAQSIHHRCWSARYCQPISAIFGKESRELYDTALTPHREVLQQLVDRSHPIFADPDLGPLLENVRVRIPVAADKNTVWKLTGVVESHCPQCQQAPQDLNNFMADLEPGDVRNYEQMCCQVKAVEKKRFELIREAALPCMSPTAVADEVQKVESSPGKYFYRIDKCF